MLDTRISSANVKTSPDEMPHLLAALNETTPETLGLSDRTFEYWRAGDLPNALLVLLDHPEIALAIWRDAERKKLAQRDES